MVYAVSMPTQISMLIWKDYLLCKRHHFLKASRESVCHKVERWSCWWCGCTEHVTSGARLWPGGTGAHDGGGHKPARDKQILCGLIWTDGGSMTHVPRRGFISALCSIGRPDRNDMIMTIIAHCTVYSNHSSVFFSSIQHTNKQLFVS